MGSPAPAPDPDSRSDPPHPDLVRDDLAGGDLARADLAHPGDDEVRALLETALTWAVVGLGGDPGRPAFRVAAFLRSVGKRVVPVHPRAAVVLGEQGYRTLDEVPVPIDVVDVFRRSDRAGRSADDAVRVGARAVWFQLGVRDPAAEQRARAAGLVVVADRCPAIEWPRLRV